MKKNKIFFTLLLLINTLSADNKEILWVEYSLVPTSILEGEFKDEGINQKTRIDIQNAFTDYHYTVEENNIARMMKMYKKYPNICGIVTKSAEREKFISFSKAFNWALPNGLIIREEDVEKYKGFLNSKNEVVLEKLLKSKKFTLAYVDERAYGKHIDTQIKNNIDLLVKLNTSEENQIKLLAKYKRVDALFGYPMKVGYFLKKYKYKYNIRYLPIENMQIKSVHIGCSKSKFGKEFIDEINPYIIEHRTKEFLDYNLEWLDVPTQKLLKKKIEMLSKDISK